MVKRFNRLIDSRRIVLRGWILFQIEPMATMREVAERAGVSIATVSYVLNDARKMRPETERKVLSAARELGYHPNSAARSLVVGRSSILGLVVPDIGNPFFPEITKSFQDAAQLSGLETVLIDTNYDHQRTRDTVDRLVSLQVPGAAFLTSQVDLTTRLALSESGICAVYLDHGVSGPLMSCIAIDYAHGIEAAVTHLLAMGHRRIGYIGGLANSPSAKQRKSAFLHCLAARADIELRVVDSDFSVQGGYFSCAKLLNDFPATALMAANDLMAIGALHCAYDRKIAVPGEISIIGFDDINFAQFMQPALTTIAVSREDIGQLAFASLWSLMSNSSREGAEYEVRTSLVLRQTTAPARARFPRT